MDTIRSDRSGYLITALLGAVAGGMSWQCFQMSSPK